MQFGEIKKLNLREVWPREANDFTPWLANNIGALGQVLGMDLELKEMEATVGSFALDLLAEDLGSGNTVVIENQISQTDHDHLGKLLTYAAGFGASIVIWVSEFIRDEHRQALEWLNHRTDEDTLFFGVVVEVLRIDDSRPAYIFKPLVAPSEWQKMKKREARGAISAKGELYREYFQTLIDELREKYRFTNAKIGQPQNWYTFSSGTSGIHFGAVFVQGGKVRTEVYIDMGDFEKNKALFDWLYMQKEEIQSKIGQESRPMEWERLDDKRASRIAVYREGAIEFNQEDLVQIKEWHIVNLVNFNKVFRPLIKKGSKAISQE